MEWRVRRAAAAVGLAAVVVAAIGVFYLRPWHAFAPAPKPAALSTLVQQLRPRIALQQLQFLSANLGWVVAGGPASASLFRTSDGGEHWQRQLDGVAGDGWMVSFFDARRGVVYGADQRGPELWRTTDGGQRWMTTAMPCQAPPSLVSFLDFEHGWCLSPGPGPLPSALGPLPLGHQEIALYRTADGGAHWSQVLATNQTQPVSGGLGDDGQKDWIWFRDAEVGWIGQRNQGGTAVMYATTDGGDHWNRQQLAPPADGWGSAVAIGESGPQEVSGRSSPWVVVSVLVPGPVQGAVTLAGRYLYTFRPGTWTGPMLLPYGALSVVDQVDQSHWLATNGGLVLETTDAGEHWMALGQVPSGWLVSRLTMTDRGNGWALLFNSAMRDPGVIPATGLARTVDGGRHWRLVLTPATGTR